MATPLSPPLQVRKRMPSRQNIEKNRSLKPFNTFGVEVSSRLFCRVDSESALQNLLAETNNSASPKLILGGGSNLLFTQDFDGIIIKNEIKGISKVDENSEHIWLNVGAGENWHAFVLYCVERGYGGIENLSLIPGTVGAAPIQNIGAYGVELKECFEKLEAIRLSDGELQTFNNSECQFGYRDSLFKNSAKNQYSITNVTLRLNKKGTPVTHYPALKEKLKEWKIDRPTIKTVSDAVIDIRQQKLPDPAKIGNAGSFFKNPIITKEQLQPLKEKYPRLPHFIADEEKIKIPAAWLIEQCGWKGKRIGNVGVHTKQSLILVNYGAATGNEIKHLAEEIQHSVNDKFSLLLQPEVNII